MIFFVAVNQHAVFAFAGDVLKADVFDFTRFCVFVAVKSCQYNRLCRAPPVGTETAGLNYDVRVTDIFHIAAVADLNGKSAVTAGDNAVCYQYISEIADAFRADFYRGRGGNQSTARNEYVLAQTVLCIAL